MAFTRKWLKAMGIEDETIEQLIEEHVSVTDGLKKQRDEYKSQAEKLATVQKELDELKAKNGEDFQAKYEAEHEAFEKYKGEVAEEKSKAEKTALYKALLKEAGVNEKRVDSVLRVADLSKVEIKDGKIKDADKLTESIKTEWADFIVQTQTKGAKVTTPPANGGADMTREQIMAVKDSSERQRLIAQNLDKFE